MDQELNLVHQELFALPVRMKHVATVGNMKLYTSNSLQDNFIKAMSKNSRLASSSGAVNSLVKQQRVVPCYLNNGIFKFLSHKILRGGSAKMIMGFYNPSSGKIYLLMDNNTSFFGYGPNAMLAELFIHEGMHMFSAQRGQQFLRYFQPELTRYYNEVFRQMFQIKSKDKFDSMPTVRWLHKTFETKSKWDSNILMKTKKYLYDTFLGPSTLSPKVLEQVCLDYVIVVKMGASNEIDALLQNRQKFQHVLGPIKNAYKNEFGGTTDSFCFQELYLPSEAIAIYSEVDQSSPKPIKALALIS